MWNDLPLPEGPRQKKLLLSVNFSAPSFPLKIYYTDRQGVPVAIDITGKEGAEKLTDNSNFFCLGPSGSGKSFHMNSVVRQLHEQGTDVVMVDTGNSYEGLCEYCLLYTSRCV